MTKIYSSVKHKLTRRKVKKLKAAIFVLTQELYIRDAAPAELWHDLKSIERKPVTIERRIQ
jgi:hypothetical protein